MQAHRWIHVALPFLGALAPGAAGQNRFVNFETPQTHPIDVAHVGGQDYVLVCNTPDNSVEIYAAAPPHSFVQRVPVGLGPASVRWNPSLDRFFVCNFDGDSISVVRMDTSGGPLVAVLERTEPLHPGDEPADIAFDPTDTYAAVTLSSQSSASLLNPLTLAPLGPPFRLYLQAPNAFWAVKMPRALEWFPDGRIFAANFRAGSPGAPTGGSYDVGLYRIDPAAAAPQPDYIGGLGTTNHAFAASPDRQTLFVVGTKAQNFAAVGVQNVAALPTGFVQSWLMVVDAPSGGTLAVHAEAAAGGPPAAPLPSINLNRDYSNAGMAEVATGAALVQPTDVLVLPDGMGGISRIALTAYHSDRVALLQPNGTVPGGYTIQRINLAPLGTGSYTVMGPRGLAYSPQQNLLFVNGRLDNSLAVLDPATGSVTAHFALQNDPTPVAIRTGRQFLYSNRFSIDTVLSQGGFVSCAACHVDGRTDGLPWDLGDEAPPVPLPIGFHDPDPLGAGTVTTVFPPEKGPMVTQTLQGLVNSKVNERFQFMATNAPYHWRGDKNDFVDFNEAFVNLQRMANIGTEDAPAGLSESDMRAYRSFINTILHPPNPEQDLARVTPGVLGSNPNDPSQASGAKLGMMVFHNDRALASRSCVDCHSLPDGSPNTAVLEFDVFKTITDPTTLVKHPFEGAALRNIAQREMAVHNGFDGNIVAFTANHGILHSGDPAFLTSSSINTFISNSFAATITNPVHLAAVVEFTRQFDTGTAPSAGLAYTVDSSLNPVNSGANQLAFDAYELQVAESNIGLGVYTRNGGTERGYWFDVTAVPPAYREEGTANLIPRAQLLGLSVGSGNVVIAQGTPLGSERRWASANGVASAITGANAPSNLSLLPMAPNTAYVDVSKFTGNLNTNAMTFSTTWALRTLQTAVLDATLQNESFGVPTLRHEPPRRFRVSGDNIRTGATMLFGFATGTSPASLPFEALEMELFPTDRFDTGGRRIWETEAELDAHQTFALLNGGYWAPGVPHVLLRTGMGPPLQPLSWNYYLVGVVNEDFTLGGDLNAWQRLRIQDTR